MGEGEGGEAGSGCWISTEVSGWSNPCPCPSSDRNKFLILIMIIFFCWLIVSHASFYLVKGREEDSTI